MYFAGAQNALFVASLCLAGPGDEVLTFEPLYPTYPATLEVSGARLVRVPAGAGWRPDLAALAALVTPRTPRAALGESRTIRAAWCSTKPELEVIGALARRHDLWLIVDEVYAGLAPGGRVPSLAARLPERVVTLGSLSKSHAMTGWRAGWLVGPARARGARRAPRHVHAVRAARIHAGGGHHRAGDCAAERGAHARLLRARALRASPRAFAASRALRGHDRPKPGCSC